MKKKLITVIMATAVFIGCVSTYIAPSYLGKNKTADTLNKDIFSNADINHTTYYEKDNGNIVEYKNGKKAEKVPVKWALAGEWEKEEDGVIFYNKILYAEIKNGYRLAFPEMKINGTKFEEYEVNPESAYVYGYSYNLSNGDKNEKYAVILTCSEKFNMDDVEICLYNDKSDNIDTIDCDIKNENIDNINLCQTYNSSTHFIKVKGHYYLIDQSTDTQYLKSDINHERIAITEDSILWMDKNASAKKLFQAIIKNHQWSNEQGGKIFHQKEPR